MINLYCGYEAAESIGFHVFVHSVIARASKPVNIVPLTSMGLPKGSNSFTVSRFLVPSLMGFTGHAIFADASDMLMLGDVAELDALFDDRFAVQVVKHDYKTRNPRKYIGTTLECDNKDYERKNWASLMLVNCAHPSWGMEVNELKSVAPVNLLKFDMLDDESIGALPNWWNSLVDEGQQVKGGALLHWTCGIPAFEHYKNAPGADLWRAERLSMEGS